MSEATPQAQGSPFWRFSLQFYRLPGVGAACIALQDEAGVDVNILLFLLWSASAGRSLSIAEVADLDRRVGAWREMAVIPLREVRRALRTPPSVIEAAIAEGFRNKIKQVELEAERLQQEATYALAQATPLGTPADPQDAARTNVDAYATVRGTAFPPAAVETLLDAFADLSDHHPPR